MSPRAAPVTYTIRRGLRPDATVRWALGALDALSGSLRGSAALRERILPHEARLLADRIERVRDMLARVSNSRQKVSEETS